jgi:hypothetical protein
MNFADWQRRWISTSVVNIAEIRFGIELQEDLFAAPS